MKNPDFVIDEMSAEGYLDVRYVAGRGVPLRIVLSFSEIRIDIDRAEEAFHIDPSDYKNNWEQFRELIDMIFTSTVKVECCGRHYTEIEFLNKENDCVDKIKHRTSFHVFKLNCSTKVYPPIYEV